MDTAAAAPHPNALRRAMLRLIIIATVLLIVAGIPRHAGHASSLSDTDLGDAATTLRLAVTRYARDHEGRAPDAADWASLLEQLGPSSGGSAMPGCGTGRVVDELPPAPDGESDWLYCRRTGELRCNHLGRATSGLAFWEL